MPGLPLKKSGVRAFLIRNSYLLDAALPLLALAATFLTGLSRFVTDPESSWSLFLAGMVASTLATAVGVVRARISGWERASKDAVPDLEACLHLLHELLLWPDKDESTSKLRLTVHAPTPDGKHFEQLLDYVGDNRALATGGRKSAIQCGIVGFVYRTQAETGMAMDRTNDDYEKFISEMVENWGYTREDAAKLNRETMTWMAVPLFNKSRIVCILYGDACVRGFFTEDRMSLVERAAASIRKLLVRNYAL